MRRGEILRTAAQVFRERGFHGAGMREIAKALGMTPGALYYYFESKEDLLYQVQILALENLIATGQAIAGSALPPPEKIERLIRAHLAQILGEMGGGLAHLEFHALPKQRLAEVVGGRDEYEALLRGLIEEGMEAGSFRPVDSKLAALSRTGLDRLGVTNVVVHLGDGTAGRAQDGPFDAILVTAGGPDVPVPLLEQLAPEGRLVGPFGAKDQQELLRIRAAPQGFKREVIGHCRFVDLVGAHGWAA